MPNEVLFDTFRGTFITWQGLCEQAATFASQIGPTRLISISQSDDKGEGVIIVWYWRDEPTAPETQA